MVPGIGHLHIDCDVLAGQTDGYVTDKIEFSKLDCQKIVVAHPQIVMEIVGSLAVVVRCQECIVASCSVADTLLGCTADMSVLISLGAIVDHRIEVIDEMLKAFRTHCNGHSEMAKCIEPDSDVSGGSVDQLLIVSLENSLVVDCLHSNCCLARISTFRFDDIPESHTTDAADLDQSDNPETSHTRDSEVYQP